MKSMLLSTFILQMRNLWHKKATDPDQAHTAKKHWRRHASLACYRAPEAAPLIIILPFSDHVSFIKS
jgi:hypothetical protein